MVIPIPEKMASGPWTIPTPMRECRLPRVYHNKVHSEPGAVCRLCLAIPLSKIYLRALWFIARPSVAKGADDWVWRNQHPPDCASGLADIQGGFFKGWTHGPPRPHTNQMLHGRVKIMNEIVCFYCFVRLFMHIYSSITYSQSFPNTVHVNIPLTFSLNQPCFLTVSPGAGYSIRS